MNVVPIVFAFDKRILLGAGVSIKSLVEHAAPSTKYDIHVFHADIKPRSIAAFEQMLSDTRHEITFHWIAPERFAGAPKSRGSWTEIVYYRLLIPEILPHYDKVLYSDVDVFFTKDMSEIYFANLDGFEWGGIIMEPNNDKMLCHKYFPENPNKYVYSSGFLLFNCKRMREEETINRFFEAIRIFNHRLKFFDLDVINIVCRDIMTIAYTYCVFESIYANDDITLSSEYEFLKNYYSDAELKHAKENCAVIHYAGRMGKPWRRKNMPGYYQDCVDSLPKELQKLSFRDWRKRLFSKI